MEQSGARPTIVAARGVDLFISLYLILIGFFIVLNSLATPQPDRALEVIQSVRATFAGWQQEERDAHVAERLAAAMDRREAFGQAVRAVVASVLENEQITVDSGGEHIRVDLPTSRLFDDGRAELRPDRQAFLNRLAVLVQQRSGQDERAVTALFSIDGARTSADNDLSIARAARLADYFAAQKIGSGWGQLPSVGITDGTNGTIHLIFSLIGVGKEGE